MSSQSSMPTYSASITTGQGGQYDTWVSKGATMSRLGNKRAPFPTCGIPVTTFSTTSNTPSTEKAPEGISGITIESQTGTGQFGSSVQLVIPNGHCLRSSSAESTEQHIDNPTITLSDDGSLVNSDDSFLSDEDEEAFKSDGGLRRSNRGQRQMDDNAKDSKEKKKVGRPIAYKGDPNAPELSELEKRRIKRRIANRESARRVRHKRQEVLDDLHLKMENLLEQNAELRAHANETRLQKDDLSVQLRDIEGKYEDLKATNMNTQQEIQALRASLQMKMTALECELDRKDNEMLEGQSAFAGPPGDFVSGYTQQPTYPLPSQGNEWNSSQSLKIALDWFPSLNLDESRSHDVMNGVMTDGNIHPRSAVINDEILR